MAYVHNILNTEKINMEVGLNLTVGFHVLKGLFQPKLDYDSWFSISSCIKNSDAVTRYFAWNK